MVPAKNHAGQPSVRFRLLIPMYYSSCNSSVGFCYRLKCRFRGGRPIHRRPFETASKNLDMQGFLNRQPVTIRCCLLVFFDSSCAVCAGCEAARGAVCNADSIAVGCCRAQRLLRSRYSFSHPDGSCLLPEATHPKRSGLIPDRWAVRIPESNRSRWLRRESTDTVD